jgi:hypothetical protein
MPNALRKRLRCGGCISRLLREREGEQTGCGRFWLQPLGVPDSILCHREDLGLQCLAEEDMGGRGRVMVGDARALIRQNDRRREFRDVIDIACDVYRERRRDADNESAYWGRREGFLRRSSNSVLGPRPSSSASRGVCASSSSASTSSASSRGRRRAGPHGSFRGERRRPDMHRR